VKIVESAPDATLFQIVVKYGEQDLEGGTHLRPKGINVPLILNILYTFNILNNDKSANSKINTSTQSTLQILQQNSNQTDIAKMVIKAGDSIPKSSLQEKAPNDQVNLAEEIGSGNALIIGVSSAFLSKSNHSWVHELTWWYRFQLRSVCKKSWSRNDKIRLTLPPGPACSDQHIPGYLASPKIKDAGKVFVVSVNDAFVWVKMSHEAATTRLTTSSSINAWGKTLDPEKKFRFLGDTSGEFTRQLGLDFESAAIFGNNRSKRYAIVVKNGKVESVNVEPDNTGVDGKQQRACWRGCANNFVASSAEKVLAWTSLGGSENEIWAAWRGSLHAKEGCWMLIGRKPDREDNWEKWEKHERLVSSKEETSIYVLDILIILHILLSFVNVNVFQTFCVLFSVRIPLS
jgi:2-Cys peroxiredoxin 5